MPLVRQSIRPVLGLALAVGLVGCGSNIHVRTQAAPNTSFAGRHTFRVLTTPRRSDGVALASNDPMLENSITNRALRDEITRDLEARAGAQLSPGVCPYTGIGSANDQFTRTRSIRRCFEGTL